MTCCVHCCSWSNEKNLCDSGPRLPPMNVASIWAGLLGNSHSILLDSHQWAMGTTIWRLSILLRFSLISAEHLNSPSEFTDILSLSSADGLSSNSIPPEFLFPLYFLPCAYHIPWLTPQAGAMLLTLSYILSQQSINWLSISRALRPPFCSFLGSLFLS